VDLPLRGRADVVASPPLFNLCLANHLGRLDFVKQLQGAVMIDIDGLLWLEIRHHKIKVTKLPIYL
jgi:hypothetical protein